MIIGTSLSEPHIDEFAVNFPYISIVRRAVNHFLLVFCVSLRHALIQTTNEFTIATSTTETRTMNGLPQQGGEGLKHFMKTGRVLQAISCPASRAQHGVQHSYISWQALSYKPSRCVRLLLQLLPEDGNLPGLRSVTLNSL